MKTERERKTRNRDRMVGAVTLAFQINLTHLIFKTNARRRL